MFDSRMLSCDQLWRSQPIFGKIKVLVVDCLSRGSDCALIKIFNWWKWFSKFNHSFAVLMMQWPSFVPASTSVDIRALHLRQMLLQLSSRPGSDKHAKSHHTSSASQPAAVCMLPGHDPAGKLGWEVCFLFADWDRAEGRRRSTHTCRPCQTITYTSVVSDRSRSISSLIQYPASPHRAVDVELLV